MDILLSTIFTILIDPSDYNEQPLSLKEVQRVQCGCSCVCALVSMKVCVHVCTCVWWEFGILF